MQEPNRFWQENAASDGCNISRAKFCIPSSPFKADEKKIKQNSSTGGERCVLYAIYNGVSRMQLTVYLEGWKESKEGEGRSVKGRRRGRWKGFGCFKNENCCVQKNKYHVTSRLENNFSDRFKLISDYSLFLCKYFKI